MPKRAALLTLGLIFVLTGCSGAINAVSPGNQDGSVGMRGNAGPANIDRWQWGMWVFQVNEDHTRIERIPIREESLHYNVTTFVENEPCPDCLGTGPIQPQGDGSFKIDVTLKHPFPGMPKYTGFDVRGTVIFHATHYWHLNGIPWYDYAGSWWSPLWTDLFFSRAEQGGGQLLNADGYSYFFFTHFPELRPPKICHYYKGEFATGTEDELDSTVNPFIQFYNIDERHIFTCDATITRTYHIQPPQGAFKFGYAVDASWCAPTNTPVIDPVTDFPEWANPEDGYSMGVQQMKPLHMSDTKGVQGLFDWKFKHRDGDPILGLHKAYVMAAGVYDDGSVEVAQSHPPNVGYYRIDQIPFLGTREIIDPWTTLLHMDSLIPPYGATEPGHYLGLCVSEFFTMVDDNVPDKAYFLYTPAFDFVDVYVES